MLAVTAMGSTAGMAVVGIRVMGVQVVVALGDTDRAVVEVVVHMPVLYPWGVSVKDASATANNGSLGD
ncbi:hypothetical protein GCM10022238_20280 [Gordonia hankookensis]